MLEHKKILILAPHTDDGELGCGGSIAKLCAQQKEVYYAAFSICRKSLPAGFPPDTLEKECKTAVTALGMNVNNLLFFDFEVREFGDKRQQILEELIKLNRSIQPDLVFVPSASDIHQDHQVIHAESLRAFKHCSLLGYELPWNQSQFQTQLFVQLDESGIEKKINALKAYQSQSQRNYMQENFIRSLATVRGVQCNATYAEAFEVYRLIG